MYAQIELVIFYSISHDASSWIAAKLQFWVRYLILEKKLHYEWRITRACTYVTNSFSFFFKFIWTVAHANLAVRSHTNNGHARVPSGRTNQTRFKNNTIILILKHFWFKYAKCDQNWCIITELSLQLKNKSLHSSGSIQPGACVVQTFHAVSLSCDINTVAHTVSSV